MTNNSILSGVSQSSWGVLIPTRSRVGVCPGGCFASFCTNAEVFFLQQPSTLVGFRPLRHYRGVFLPGAARPAFLPGAVFLPGAARPPRRAPRVVPWVRVQRRGGRGELSTGRGGCHLSGGREALTSVAMTVVFAIYLVRLKGVTHLVNSTRCVMCWVSSGNDKCGDDVDWDSV